MRFGPEGFCDTLGFQVVLARSERVGPDPSVRYFTDVPVRALCPLAEAVRDYPVPTADRLDLVTGVDVAVQVGADLISGFRVLPFRVDERVEITAMSGPGRLPRSEFSDHLSLPPPAHMIQDPDRWQILWPLPNVRADLAQLPGR